MHEEKWLKGDMQDFVNKSKYKNVYKYCTENKRELYRVLLVNSDQEGG